MASHNHYQFLNSFYHKREYDKRKVVEEDCLEIVYRNLETGKKGIMKNVKPKISYYQLNEKAESEAKYYRDYVRKDEVVPRTSYYADLLWDLKYYAENSYNGNKVDLGQGGKPLKQYHQIPIFYSSDIDIEDYYKGKFLDKYDSSGFYLTKGYFDIEVDIKGHKGFPDQNEALCPVNALTYVNEENRTAYVLLLRNSENPLIQDLEDNIEDFRKEIEDEFREVYGEFTYRFLFFDKELGLIKSFFDLVNDLQPDFMLA